MRLMTLVGLITIALPAAATAQFVGTGSTAIGTQDPNWTVSWTSGPYGPGGSSTGFYDAWVVPDVSGVWQPDGSGTDWISAWQTASAPGGGGDYNETTGADEEYIYTFTYTFNSLSSGSLLFDAGWDNIFQSFTINGTSYAPSALLTSTTDADVDNHFGFCRDGDGMLNSNSYPNCTATFSAPGMVAGSNTIQVVLLGDGTTDGLWLNAAQLPPAVGPEPSTMTLTALGLVAMLGAGARRRRKASR
ncbi:MAG TPA: PEP-CTERM sorting domain-containing protein [Gemmatimonadales bacterium]|jgi:hypothetical protein|nr:PEP-CTERM sorting domain-containing protein [Gemmatimonadales bacterium]